MLETLSLYQSLLALAILTAAYTFRGITGFGSGLISIPLLALFLPLTFVVPIISFVDLLASLAHSWHHRQHTSWQELLPVLPSTLLGVVVALYLFRQLDNQKLVMALGVFIIAYALYALAAIEFHRQCHQRWSILAGSIGGFISTLFGTGGPLYVIYFQLRQLDKTVFRSTIATAFLIEGSMRIVSYGLAGYYDMYRLQITACAVPVMLLGLFIGGHIHTSISQLAFRRLIATLLLISGSALLLK